MSAIIAKAASFLAALFIGLAAPQAAVQPPVAEAPARDASVLQNAIDDAAPLSTVVLPQGLFKGTLLVAKPLKIVASGGTVLVAGDHPEGSTLSILADDVSLFGITVRGSGGDAKTNDAGILLKGKGITLDSCAIEGAFFGMRLELCSECAILRCRVAGDPHLPFAKRGDGIRVTRGRDCLVEDCDIASVCDGIYLDGATRPRVLGLRIFDARYGAHVMYGSSARVEGLQARRLVVGAMVMGTKGAMVAGNGFSEGRDARSSGIVLFESEFCSVLRNAVSGFASGLVVDEAKSCSVEGNAVSGNARGIVVQSASPGTRVASNAFEDNAQSVAGAGDATSIEWSEGGRGNYWDDYKGYDLDGDGIGDAPYRRSRGFAALIAKEPLLGVFFGSPLQRAVDGLDPDAQVLDTRPLIRH